MLIEELEIHGLRNLVPTRLSPSPTVNLVYGANAAGKTSLLEALYLLGTARSFRNNRPQELIQHGQKVLTVSGRVRREDGGGFRVGVQRSLDETQIRLDGRNVHNASELAVQVPVLVIAPETHDFLEGGPGVRRRLLDWGLFHVEPGYLEIWQTYYRVLKQRNASLRSGAADAQVRAWDSALAKAAERLDSARSGYVRKLLEFLGQPLAGLTEGQIDMRYFQGWDGGRAYASVLHERLAADRERGHTGPGPHRADLVFSLGGRPLRSRLSRGQAKLFTGALRSAQARLLRAETGKGPLVLVDDFAAELDAQGRERFLRSLAGPGWQLFLTVTERELGPVALDDRAAVFHVEHGKVAKVI